MVSFSGMDGNPSPHALISFNGTLESNLADERVLLIQDTEV